MDEYDGMSESNARPCEYHCGRTAWRQGFCRKHAVAEGVATEEEVASARRHLKSSPLRKYPGRAA